MSEIKIVLGSKSPRRKELVQQLGFQVRLIEADVEEVYPDNLPLQEVPVFLATLKGEALKDRINPDEYLLTADTVVLLDGKILGKPKDREEAIHMLTQLSGRTHEVLTGVYLYHHARQNAFSVSTSVHFNTLDPQAIVHYVDHFKPFDKAGSYGIQEWIGFIGIDRIDGCFYNVMGLPLSAIYREIHRIIA